MESTDNEEQLPLMPKLTDEDKLNKNTLGRMGSFLDK